MDRYSDVCVCVNRYWKSPLGATYSGKRPRCVERFTDITTYHSACCRFLMVVEWEVVKAEGEMHARERSEEARGSADALVQWSRRRDGRLGGQP